MTSAVPHFLFLALASANVDELRRDGVSSAAADDMVHLYDDTAAAASAILPAPAVCLLMIYSERMIADGFRIAEVGEGVWAVGAVPPDYLWISESS